MNGLIYVPRDKFIFLKIFHKLRNEHSTPKGASISLISNKKHKPPEMQLQMQDGTKNIYKNIKTLV